MSDFANTVVFGEKLNNIENSYRRVVFLFFVTLLTRLPFQSKLLYHYDSVQFALALEKYDPYLHQPHPPGYFLYVMTGKALYFFLQNANSSFILISLIASGLAVVAIYYLGEAVFDARTGRWAALLAMTSPLLWFYGEVALSYVVAAVFNSWIAALCWQSLHKDSKRVYVSAILLGVGAGIRQDLLMFLFPLWIFSIAQLGWRKLVSALLILGVTVAAWFVPMLVISGGVERYSAAVNEFWRFHYSYFAIWKAETPARLDVLLTLMGFASYGVGIGSVFILFGLYASIRTGYWRAIEKDRLVFFALWLLPELIFHYIIFLLPYNHAYGLFLLPALCILLPRLVEYVIAELRKVAGYVRLNADVVAPLILGLLVIINAGVFCLTDISYSAKSIRKHDRNLAIMLAGIKNNFSKDETIIIDFRSSIFYGYRHIQYYLPDYTVYLADQRTKERGETRHIFAAMNGKTFFAKTIRIPENTRYILYVMDPSDEKYERELQQQHMDRITLENAIRLYYQQLKRDL